MQNMQNMQHMQHMQHIKHIYVNIYKSVLIIFYSIVSISHGNERTVGPTY